MKISVWIAGASLLATAAAWAGPRSAGPDLAGPDLAGPDAVPGAGLDGEAGVIEVRARTNPGNLPYAAVLKTQQRLRAVEPPEPRLVDLVLRMILTELPPERRDSFEPDNWGAAIVGKDLEVAVPIARGGYFVLPDVPPASAEGATLMFNAQTRNNFMGVAWLLRRPQGTAIDYRHFARALEQARQGQAGIPWYRFSLKLVKQARLDILKACFTAAGGKMLVEGARVAQRGSCWAIRFDPALVESNPQIRFEGTLDRITLETSTDW